MFPGTEPVAVFDTELSARNADFHELVSMATTRHNPYGLPRQTRHNPATFNERREYFVVTLVHKLKDMLMKRKRAQRKELPRVDFW